MNAKRKQPDSHCAKLLTELDLTDTLLLLDCLSEVQFWIKDASGRYLRVNQTFQLDYSLASMADAIGKTDYDLSPPWIAEAFRADDSLVLSGQRIVNRIELISGYDCALRWYQTNKIPLRNRRGDFAATAGIATLLPDLKGPAFPLPHLAPALEVMQDESKTSLTNAGLAELVGLSVSAFERQFRLHLHTSPMQFHRKLRLARAAAALIQSPKSIAEIAQRFGFSDQAHLTRQFKDVYGSTPSAWRDKHAGSRQP
jgi:AraC-like DNA-binding protein